MKQHHSSLRSLAVSLFIASQITVGAAIAQDGDVTEVELQNQGRHIAADIVVTAQKRVESAQDVPISLVAISSENLEKAAVTNVLDLGRMVPGFTTSRATQPANTRISIRGIGSAGNAAIEPSVGAFVDGIYIARPGPLLAAINDVASVEVLRGPQGTLFGRNASVGALSFNTHAPKDEFEGSLSADYGSFNRVVLNGLINLPIQNGLATRFSVLFNENDGYGRDVLQGGKAFGGVQTLSLRGAVKAELSPALEWTFRGDYQRQRGNAQSITTVVTDTLTPAARQNFIDRLNGLTPLLDKTYTRDIRQLTGGGLKDHQYGLASDLSLNIGDYSLRLLSGVRDWKSLQQEEDTTLTPADLFGRDSQFRSKSHSQELQLISPENLLDGRLRFVAGAYYFREDYRIEVDTHLGYGFCNIYLANTRPTAVTPCLAAPQRFAGHTFFDQTTESLAGYGQATYKFADNWDVTAGLRYSHDNKKAYLRSQALNNTITSLVANDEANLEFDGGRFTYRINTSWHPSKDVMLFATLSTGYKSGGFDSGTGNALGQNRVFRPETTKNYELGVKAELADRQLTVNSTLFRMDISDFQL